MRDSLQTIEIDTRPGKRKPVYEQIADHLRQRIMSPEVDNGMTLPAISEIMKQLDIAYPTVKTALDILEKENLIRYQVGRGKGHVIKKTRNTGTKLKISFHRWCNQSQFLDLENGIRGFCEEGGCQFKVIDSSFFDSYNPRIIAAESKGMDGLIVYPVDTEEYVDAIREVREMGVSVVFADRFLPDSEVSSVCADNFSGGYLATCHLIEEHNGPVHYFGNIEKPRSSNLRYQGWYQAMREHFVHVEFVKDFVWEVPFTEDRGICRDDGWRTVVGEAACRALKSLSVDECCVFCSNDDAALVLSEAARGMGRSVGENFFVVGFGDKPYCSRMEVPQSSVAQFDEKFGYEAAKLLGSIIDNPSLACQRINRIIPFELKIRHSSVKI